ncbi:MAG: ATP-binding protein, partial [Anaerolineae bacterium]|nr:ATP-binding protein [Anaerolineae bacterium]
ITLHDWGKTFDPSSVPEPDFDVPLDKMNSRGAGLILIRKIMDETNFRFTEKDGNFLTMVKHKKSE